MIEITANDTTTSVTIQKLSKVLLGELDFMPQTSPVTLFLVHKCGTIFTVFHRNNAVYKAS